MQALTFPLMLCMTGVVAGLPQLRHMTPMRHQVVLALPLHGRQWQHNALDAVAAGAAPVMRLQAGRLSVSLRQPHEATEMLRRLILRLQLRRHRHRLYLFGHQLVSRAATAAVMTRMRLVVEQHEAEEAVVVEEGAGRMKQLWQRVLPKIATKRS